MNELRWSQRMLTAREQMHRHHKRTVYAANSFPVESYPWDCNGEGLYHYGRPLAGAVDGFGAGQDVTAASSYWQGYVSPVNPFRPPGFQGTCQFPQITSGGLDDSWQHGADLYATYHDLLGFLPSRREDWQKKAKYRVTHNVITSQVAGMVINGMWGSTGSVPLLVEVS